MTGFSVAGNENLIRSNLWSAQIKEVLLDELFAMQFVDMITDFPDGTTLNIPSIGQAESFDFVEGEAVRYTGMDTGNFTFTIDQYKSSATYITEQMKQDSFYMGRLIASFVPKQHRAIMKAMEARIFSQASTGQTANDKNVINTGDHRYVGTGTSNRLSVTDIAKARFSLQKANVPMTNLIGIVDPATEYVLSTQTNLVNLINNPQWEGVVRDGMSTGLKFRFNIYGFDIYVSQNLPTGVAETIVPTSGTSATTTNATVCQFFSAAPDVKHIVGSLRQPPKVDSDYNKDLQREEYVTTARYGFKLYRPENFVAVLTETTV